MTSIKRLLFVGVLTSMNFFSSVFASDLGSMNIHVTANIVAKTCEVSTDSKNKTVELGKWSDRDLMSGMRPVRFVITLGRCGKAATGVEASFDGNRNSENNELLSLHTTGGSAKNVGLALLDRNQASIKLGKPTTVYPLKSGSNDTELVFFAQYIATSLDVKGGAANSSATFTLEYQ